MAIKAAENKEENDARVAAQLAAYADMPLEEKRALMLADLVDGADAALVEATLARCDDDVANIIHALRFLFATKSFAKGGNYAVGLAFSKTLADWEQKQADAKARLSEFLMDKEFLFQISTSQEDGGVAVTICAPVSAPETYIANEGHAVRVW